MTIYYTYLIGWSTQKKYYYGVRYAKNCNPKDLWESYFTSSKHVAEYRILNGEPDVIQVRKTFHDPKDAIAWETKILTRMNVLNDDKWLNKTNNKAICSESARMGGSKSKSKRMKERLSKSLTGRKLSEETKRKISQSKKGQPSPFKGKSRNLSDEVIEKLSNIRKALVGEKNAFYGKKHSEEAKRLQGKANIGNKYRLGKTHSEETKRKISEAKRRKSENNK